MITADVGNQWLQNGPVSDDAEWKVTVAEGYMFNHNGWWELNGGALVLFTRDRKIHMALGAGAWKSVQPRQ